MKKEIVYTDKYALIGSDEINQTTMEQTKISIETARVMYERGGTAKEFALENFTQQELFPYPTTWEECFGDNPHYYVGDDSTLRIGNANAIRSVRRNEVNTKEQALAIIALTQLLVCRDAYRNGWKPDLSQEERHIRIASLIVQRGEWSQAYYFSQAEIFSFEKKEQAQAFLENFKDLLEQVKPLYL